MKCPQDSGTEPSEHDPDKVSQEIGRIMDFYTQDKKISRSQRTLTRHHQMYREMYESQTV